MTDYLGCCFYKLAATPGRSGVDNSRVVLLTLKATVTHHHCHIVQITLLFSPGGSILAELRTSETMSSALWAAPRAVSEAETCRSHAGLSWTS